MLLRIQIFISIWGSDYYDERIDADFAWELARVMAEHDEELSRWEELKG